MSLISPNKLQKKKLKEIILKLFPQYQFVRFGPKGILFLSKSFWHFLFKRELIHITEMCTVLIPERLEKLDSRKLSDETVFPYQRVYNKYSHIVLDLLHHRANNIIDYLYDEYTFMKYNIQTEFYEVNNVLPVATYSLSNVIHNYIKKDSIVLHSISNAHLKQMLKRWTEVPFVLNHPVLRSNYLNMWFKQEIKQQLNQIYNIRIAFG